MILENHYFSNQVPQPKSSQYDIRRLSIAGAFYVSFSIGVYLLGHNQLQDFLIRSQNVANF